jgi:hypothetical protein
MKCDQCGKENESVIAINDPYLKSMYDMEIILNLCDECLVDRQLSV